MTSSSRCWVREFRLQKTGPMPLEYLFQANEDISEVLADPSLDDYSLIKSLAKGQGPTSLSFSQPTEDALSECRLLHVQVIAVLEIRYIRYLRYSRIFWLSGLYLCCFSIAVLLERHPCLHCLKTLFKCFTAKQSLCYRLASASLFST